MNTSRKRKSREQEKVLWNKHRVEACSANFRRLFGREATHVFSCPGRTELGGNHTDHNRGRVLAASVDLDMLAAVAPRTDETIRVFSEAFRNPFEVHTRDLVMHEEERGTSLSLIRGIVATFIQRGYAAGGFDAWVTSRVGVGSGLSSSASFEVLIGSILNTLYNKDKVSRMSMAAVGQVAENDFFGKPCGLMDQITCSVGGTLKIDFRDPSRPQIRQLRFDPRDFGFDLVVVNTGSSHEDLTGEYAAIPAEMRSVARFFGANDCRDVDRRSLLERLPEVRAKCGDRAVLRCLHFLDENERVEEQFAALKERRFAQYLTLVQKSGDSSAKYLQNIFPPKHPQNQNVTLALAATETFLSKYGRGAFRVHGGGFAGTIQAYIPAETTEKYRRTMSSLFGAHSVQPLILRPGGVSSRVL